LPADRGHALRVAQHGEDPSAVDLPETRGGVTLGGPRTGRRPAPALRPSPGAGITLDRVTLSPAGPDRIGPDSRLGRLADADRDRPGRQCAAATRCPDDH